MGGPVAGDQGDRLPVPPADAALPGGGDRSLVAPRSYGAPSAGLAPTARDPDPVPGPRPYGTAHGLPPPAAYPFGTAADGRAAAQAGPPVPAAPSAAPAGGPWTPPPPVPRPGAEPWPVPPVPAAARPEDVARARRLGRLAVYNAVVGIIFSLVFFPVGLPLDILAIVLGIKARRAAVRAGRSEGAGVLAVVLGGVGLSAALAIAAVLAVFWPEVSAYRDCEAGANTHVASDACQDALQDDLLRRLGQS